MGKSDEYIEYDAYVRYLKKVTGEPDHFQKVKDDVLEKAVENTEMQMALMILKRLTVAVSITVVISLLAGGIGYLSVDKEYEPVNLWSRSRDGGEDAEGALRLYEAYEHSAALRYEIIDE